MVSMRQRKVEEEATMNELKKALHSSCEEKSSLYHSRVKWAQGAGKGLALKEKAMRTRRGR